MSPVHEGGGDLGQEQDGTQVTRHSFSWRSFYILIQVCSQCSSLLMNTRSALFLLLLEAHHKFSLLSLCVAAQYTDFPDYPSMGSRVTCSINILTGWLRDLWSRWGGRAVDFPWPSTSSCSPLPRSSVGQIESSNPLITWLVFLILRWGPKVTFLTLASPRKFQGF